MIYQDGNTSFPASSFGTLGLGTGVWPYHSHWYGAGLAHRAVSLPEHCHGFGTPAGDGKQLFYGGIASKLSQVHFDCPRNGQDNPCCLAVTG